MADKIRSKRYNCPLLKGIAKLTLRDIYADLQQSSSPIFRKTQFKDCDSKDFCGIRKPDGSYDEDLCPACITLNKGGNL